MVNLYNHNNIFSIICQYLLVKKLYNILKQAAIAEVLGTTAQYYGRYEKGEIELPLSRAIQLADHYNVSLDYLAGRSLFKRETALDEDEEWLLKCWRALSERSKGKIDYHIEELLKYERQIK